MAFLRLPPLIAGGGLRANLQHALGFLDGVDQLPGFLVGVAHRLFKIDVLAVVHGVERDLGVPVVGRGDDDGVHVAALQHLAVIEIAFAVVFFGRRAFALFVDIADRDDLAGVVGVAVVMERFGVVAAAAAHADDAQVDAVVGADDAVAHFGAASSQGRTGHAEGNSCRTGGFQKISAIRHACLPRGICSGFSIS